MTGLLHKMAFLVGCLSCLLSLFFSWLFLLCLLHHHLIQPLSPKRCVFMCCLGLQAHRREAWSHMAGTESAATATTPLRIYLRYAMACTAVWIYIPKAVLALRLITIIARHVLEKCIGKKLRNSALGIKVQYGPANKKHLIWASLRFLLGRHLHTNLSIISHHIGFNIEFTTKPFFLTKLLTVFQKVSLLFLLLIGSFFIVGLH